MKPSYITWLLIVATSLHMIALQPWYLRHSFWSDGMKRHEAATVSHSFNIARFLVTDGGTRVGLSQQPAGAAQDRNNSPLAQRVLKLSLYITLFD